MLKWLVEEFEKSGIYKNFISNLPYPFNDLYFGLLIIFILACLIVVYVLQGIRSKAMREKIRKRQEEARIRRIEEKEKEKNDRDELMKLMRENSTKSAVKTETKEKDDTRDIQTGVHNRFSYNRVLNHMDIRDLLVIYVDVNNLKKTNDQYGKAYGDKLLKAVACELKENFSDKCYRTGGDEFVVLINGMSEKIAIRKIDRIRNNLEALTESDSEGIVYSAAFGVAFSDGRLSKQEIIDLAEERMKENKLKIKTEQQKKYGDDGYVDERISNFTDDEEDTEDVDVMTGCKSREAFEERVRSIDETGLSIVMADIDGLKVINDKINHHAGDTVIKGFSKILRKYFKGCVYRLSDDDFCVITDKESKDSLFRKLDLIKAEMIKLTEESDNGLFYSASFGISTNADDGDLLIDKMLDECQIKMRADKEEYRSGRRNGVIVSDLSLIEDKNSKEEDIHEEIDISGILDEKRNEVIEPADMDEKNALTALLFSMKERQEEAEEESEIEEKRRLEKEKKEEELNEEIRAKYNKEDMTGRKRVGSRQAKETERAVKSEMEKLSKEEKKKKGLFSKHENDSDDETESDVSGNTVNDVDIL